MLLYLCIKDAMSSDNGATHGKGSCLVKDNCTYAVSTFQGIRALSTATESASHTAVQIQEVRRQDSLVPLGKILLYGTIYEYANHIPDTACIT